MTTEAEKALWIVKDMEDDAERAYDNDPASSYRLSAQAAAARRTWAEAHPDAAAELTKQERVEHERAEQERAGRRKINLNSYAARGMD